MLWDDGDPDGAKLQRVTEAVGDDPPGTVDDWSGDLNAGPDDSIGARTACGERLRVFSDIMDGKQPRLAAGNAFGTGESRAEMWEWLGGRPAGRAHDPSQGSVEDYTADAHHNIERSLTGMPPGTVALSRCRLGTRAADTRSPHSSTSPAGSGGGTRSRGRWTRTHR